MSRETCYCGLNSLDTEVVEFCVMGEPCCTRACYNEALEAATFKPTDNFHLKDPHAWDVT